MQHLKTTVVKRKNRTDMKDKEIKKKFPLAIDEITKNIIDNYNPNKIILFGSVAKESTTLIATSTC